MKIEHIKDEKDQINKIVVIFEVMLIGEDDWEFIHITFQMNN